MGEVLRVLLGKHAKKGISAGGGITHESPEGRREVFWI